MKRGFLNAAPKSSKKDSYAEDVIASADAKISNGSHEVGESLLNSHGKEEESLDCATSPSLPPLTPPQAPSAQTRPIVPEPVEAQREAVPPHDAGPSSQEQPKEEVNEGRGESEASQTPPPPIAPTAEVVGDPGAQSVRVKCDCGDNPEGTSYVFLVESDDQNQHLSKSSLPSNGACEACIDGLLPGRHYKLCVAISSPSFPSSPEDVVGTAFQGPKTSFVAGPAPPETPAAPTVGGKSKTSVKLRWSPPAHSCGSAVTSYTCEVFRNPLDGGVPVATYDGPDARFEAKGLRAGTPYMARVAATNALGTSPYSEWVMVSTSATVPGIPEEPLCAQIGLGWIGVAWGPPSEDGGSSITAYTLEVEEGPEGSGYIAKYSGPNTVFVLQGAAPTVPYRFRVKASSAVGGSQFSSPLEVVGACGPTGPPGICVVERQYSHALTVAWTPPEVLNGAPPLMYQVGMRPLVEGVATNFVVVHTGDACRCDVGGLQPACLYEFVVVAVSAHGPSPPSSPSVLETACAPPDGPDPPFLVSGGPNFLHIGWRPPAITNGSPPVCFRLEAVGGDYEPVVVFEGPSFEAPLQNLQPGKALWLRVSAANALGYGPPSPTVCFTTGLLPPGPPSGVCADKITKTSARLQWEASQHDGGGVVTGYRVQCARLAGSGEEAGAPWSLMVEGVETRVCTVEKLMAGTQYTARVQAINTEGVGLPSPSVTFSTEAGPPGAPDAPTLVGDPAGCELSLCWAAPERCNGADVSEYCLQVQDLSQGGGFSALYTGCLTSFDVSSLRPGTPYAFRVRAANSAGSGPFSPSLNVTTTAVAPGPPLAVTPIAVTHNTLKLKWSPPAFTGGSAPHAYSVMVSDEGGTEAKEAWSGPTTSCKIKVFPDTVAHVSVVAFNAIGPGTSSSICSVTIPPAPVKQAPVMQPPKTLAAPNVSVKGPHSAVVSWGMGGKNKGCEYELELSVGGAEQDFASCYSGSQCIHSLQNLQPNETYSVRVAALNDAGRGHWSAVADFFTKASPGKNQNKPPGAPERLELEKAGKSLLKFRWKEGPDGEASGVSYRVEVCAEGADEFAACYTGKTLEYCAKKLKPNRRYTVRVQALNKWGASPYCMEKTFKTAGDGGVVQGIVVVLIAVLLTFSFLGFDFFAFLR
uniref:Fibronectin type-III domain-containing protein n=1 Tax=Hemiselmis andersenii TaxID=464988 RepID=A0A6U4VBP4_HEMAN|mmetsp:Transcript_36244/g.84980  ORF Transcript_36244/g.84980 Transcript_36244/m.84980 type:complete len:1145 (+) Transcript_36244:127-3561(+)